MTLVVARIVGDRIAIAADTMLTAGDTKLPIDQWVLKSVCLPGGICVSYCNSPELAFRSFRAFREKHPTGAGFAEVVAFFEDWSSRTNNDFLIAFADPARLVTVRDGKRTAGLSHTHWIGDHAAYTRFRHSEQGKVRMDDGRAVSAAMFADEMSGSPASALYSTMQNVVRDPRLTSVGGLVTVLSNRAGHFRYSVYSDALFDWPEGRSPTLSIDSRESIDLAVSGENDRYSLSQVSSGYYDINAVAFYYLRGRLLILLVETDGGCHCRPIRNVRPDEIAGALDRHFGFPFRALCLVMSARSDHPPPDGWRSAASPNAGMGLSLFCEVNTMPRTSSSKIAEPQSR